MAGNNYKISSNNTTDPNSKINLQKIAHDLNNLLNNIINGLELVSENINSKPTAIALLDKLKKNSLLASNIISSLSNKNYQSSLKEKISLERIINETISLQELSEENKDKITYDNFASNNFVLVNYIDIQRVLLNLINNTFEADSSAEIKILTKETTDNKIELIIEDNGPGIAPEVIPHIFEEGYSTKKYKLDKNKGLGLAIAKEIIEQYDGIIKVESQLRKGTLFKIIFPLYKKTENKKTYTNKKIIIGEDDPFQLEVLKDLLSSLNITTLSATNGIEVLELLSDHNPDLIFIDKTMPVMDGLECIEKILEMNINVPIVVTSGADIQNLRNDGNIIEVLKKPYSFDMVQNLLEKLI